MACQTSQGGGRTLTAGRDGLDRVRQRRRPVLVRLAGERRGHLHHDHQRALDRAQLSGTVRTGGGGDRVMRVRYECGWRL
jgi:hypothetical protein